MNLGTFLSLLAMLHILFWPTPLVQAAVHYQYVQHGYVAGWSK